MAYAFDSTGDSFSELQERVLANSFNSTRYLEVVKAELNAGVEQVCKRLSLFRSFAICAHSSSGAVTQPAAPFWRVEELWTASATSGTTEADFARYAQRKLEPLPWRSAGGLRTGSLPLYYTARRLRAPGTRAPSLQITIVPATSAGYVAIAGLQRPAVMSLDADVTGLGDDLDRAVLAYAKARCFELEDDFQMSQQWDARFETMLREGAVDFVADGPKVTPGAWDDDMTADGGR